jgi:hypothetical protein
MLGLYSCVFLLQAFCVYHAYRNNAEQRWYWLILLFPLVGCIIYLIHNFNNPAAIESITENVKEVVVSNYRIDQLEKALKFSDNVKNKTNLADAYAEAGRYQDAIPLYLDCLKGFMADDPSIRMKLLRMHFLNGDHANAIALGGELAAEKGFRNSEERIAYAWALYITGDVDNADTTFADMDRSFTNYNHRLEYCKFLLKADRADAAREKLTELMDEFDQMQSIERRAKKHVLREAKDLYANHFSAA